MGGGERGYVTVTTVIYTHEYLLCMYYNNVIIIVLKNIINTPKGVLTYSSQF